MYIIHTIKMKVSVFSIAAMLYLTVLILHYYLLVKP